MLEVSYQQKIKLIHNIYMKWM